MGSTSARKRVWFVFKHFVLFCAAVGQLLVFYKNNFRKTEVRTNLAERLNYGFVFNGSLSYICTIMTIYGK